MNIQDTLKNDIRTKKCTQGAYEWWYFDAISNDGCTELVIIFYEGNPFSRRYIQHQQNGTPAMPGKFPAISISIYQDKQPVYYSFTEVAEKHAEFLTDVPSFSIENHSMKARAVGGKLSYTISLNERLPSGDAIEGRLTFTGEPGREALSSITGAEEIPHRWHIIQPRASVNGKLNFGNGRETEMINFEGRGYHDHNIGREPLKKQFEHWYWGRFHFKNATLVYYLMGDNQPINNGWLLDGHGRVLQHFGKTEISDYSRTFYGLQTGRKIAMKSNDCRIMIQQSNLLDNGPFYQRFSSTAFLTIPGQDIMDSSRGITEYLCPPRIYNRLYWPLTNMRIRYKKEAPHWVQRSKTLYRWTW